MNMPLQVRILKAAIQEELDAGTTFRSGEAGAAMLTVREVLLAIATRDPLMVIPKRGRENVFYETCLRNGFLSPGGGARWEVS